MAERGAAQITHVDLFKECPGYDIEAPTSLADWTKSHSKQKSLSNCAEDAALNTRRHFLQRCCEHRFSFLTPSPPFLFPCAPQWTLLHWVLGRDLPSLHTSQMAPLLCM